MLRATQQQSSCFTAWATLQQVGRLSACSSSPSFPTSSGYSQQRPRYRCGSLMILFYYKFYMLRLSFRNLNRVIDTRTSQCCVQRPITCNMGTAMPGWYDIINMEGINSQEDEGGVLASAKCDSTRQLCLCPMCCMRRWSLAVSAGM